MTTPLRLPSPVISLPDSTLSAPSLPPFRPSGAPMLPASSGAFFGTRTHLVKKDAEFVKAHTEHLDARVEQYNAANRLMEARVACELTAGRLGNIDLIKQHEFRRGQHDRQQEERGWQHQHQLSAIQRDTQLVQAEAALLEAKAQRAALQALAPQPEAPERALSVDDLEELVAVMPELSEDQRAAFLRMARGLLSEKRAAAKS